MDDEQLAKVVARAFEQLPQSGELLEQDREKFRGAIEELVQYLPGTGPNT